MPIDPTVAARFAPYLMPNETLLWTGHPPHKMRILSGDKKLVPYGLLIVTYAMIFAARNLGSSYYDRIIFAIFFVTMMGLAIVAFWFRLMQSRSARKATVYAISNKHVFFMTDREGRSFTSIPRSSLGALFIEQKSGQSAGNLLFLNHTQAQHALVSFGKAAPICFEAIDDPVAVRQLLLHGDVTLS